MTFYYSLRDLTPTERKRTVKGLQRLRKQLDEEMPARTRKDTLVLGTWNIRNFDDNRFGHGKRTREDLFYIAEILSRFDVIAVQEICRDMRPLKDVMRILGDRDFDYIVSDPTEGRSGNDERLGFIFDRSKVWFGGIAGELVLPDNMQIIDGEKKRQFSRTPFKCSFQSGWFKFLFSTVHIYFGSDSGAKYERRVAEIQEVAKFLAKRAKRDPRNHVLVGDFNIKSNTSRGYNALTDAGFTIFQNNEGTNRTQTKFYDQISFLTREGELRPKTTRRSKGVLQFFDSIFRTRDFSLYEKDMRHTLRERVDDLTQQRNRTRSTEKRRKLAATIAELRSHLSRSAAGKRKLKKYYETEWRTFRASDHLPLWVELEIDFSAEYLERLAN